MISGRTNLRKASTREERARHRSVRAVLGGSPNCRKVWRIGLFGGLQRVGKTDLICVGVGGGVVERGEAGRGTVKGDRLGGNLSDNGGGSRE